jgi:predicted nuclease with TOPRIM domain
MNQEPKNLLNKFENKVAAMWQLDGQLMKCDDERSYLLENCQKRFKVEVDEARAELIAAIERLEHTSVADSWARNPDRSGGQFTQHEIDESKRGGHGW